VHARAEQFQIAGGHRRGAYRDRSVTAKIEVETGAAGDRRKGSIVPLPFGQLRQRKADPITFSRNLSELVQLARILEGERSHERGTRHCEHRGDGRDPERHRADGYRRERRRTAQGTNALTDIPRECIHERHRCVPNRRA